MLANARKDHSIPLKFTKHVMDDIYPSSVVSTNEPLVGVQVKANYLEYIKVAGNSFQYFSRLKSLMGHYNHSILVDANIMVSTNCPVIGNFQNLRWF